MPSLEGTYAPAALRLLGLKCIPYPPRPGGKTNCSLENLLEMTFLMGYLGLEPRTYRLKAEYSTIELATLFLFV